VGFNSVTGLPDEAIDLLLNRAGRVRSDIQRYVLAARPANPSLNGAASIDLHYAHACAAYLSSSFSSAAIVVCDGEAPGVTVWMGSGGDISPVEWPWTGIGFSELYARCARIVGFEAGNGQRFEALARLEPEVHDARLEKLFRVDDRCLALEDGWEAKLSEWITARASISERSSKAAALQTRIGDLLLEFLKAVQHFTQAEQLCLGGDLFFHSSINTRVRKSGLFSRVFIPVDPGSAGLAVGAALSETKSAPSLLSAFLGPAYATGETKAILDNCKLPYTLVGRREYLQTAVEALLRGKLIAWYEGAMEWGRRALGARSILASPFSPYVLDNLNQFLKHREPWRGYALSVLESVVKENFEGPSESPYMECDFRPRDVERFRHVLPSTKASIRVQTVGTGAPLGFRDLLAACAEVGLPCLVNTSFNGFHEPIVCSPRDAIRVFYGSGLDLLFLDGFLLEK